MARTNDPVRDAERHYSEQDEKERACLHCVVCGATIGYGEDYWDMEDGEFCQECAEMNFRRTNYNDDL